MIHEDIYFTCDRCGARIDMIPSYAKDYASTISKSALTLEILSVDVRGYVTNKEALDLPDVQSIEIIEDYGPRHSTKHLCKKCRKDFKRFMKGENL